MAGFGGHKLATLEPSLSGRIVSVYNDAMAEMQEGSNGRLLPMALVPFWDIDMAVTEVARAASLGLKGIVMCSEPHAGGLPDLVDQHWDPLWELCTERPATDQPPRRRQRVRHGGVHEGGVALPDRPSAGTSLVACRSKCTTAASCRTF